jgi:hypothetical protein
MAITDPEPRPAPMTTAVVCDRRDVLIPVQRRVHRESHRREPVRLRRDPRSPDDNEDRLEERD